MIRTEDSLTVVQLVLDSGERLPWLVANILTALAAALAILE